MLLSHFVKYKLPTCTNFKQSVSAVHRYRGPEGSSYE